MGIFDQKNIYNQPDGLPGYGSKNPMGTSGSSWGGSSVDWSKGNGIDWGKGSPAFGVADENDPILGSKERGQSRWREAAEKSATFRQQREREDGARFGSSMGGSAGQVLENLGYIYAPQHAPTFAPGVEGKKGIGGALGTMAGIGLSFIPGIGPGLAAALPSIGGAAGSMFG